MTYILSKILAYIFLPPGIFILLLLLLLGLSYRTKRTTTRVVLGCMIVLLYAVSIEPVSRLLLIPLERVHPYRSVDSFSADEAEAIVVLGAGIQNGTEAFPSEEALPRVLHGFLIQKQTGLPIVVSGGSSQPAGSGGTLNSEAEAMKNLLLKLGTPDDMIVMEDTSRNTIENAGNLAATGRFSSVILVTSAYHMPRSFWIFEKSGFTVIPAPAGFSADFSPESSSERAAFDLWSFLPSMQPLGDSCKALHEYGGIIFQLLHYVNNEKKG